MPGLSELFRRYRREEKEAERKAEGVKSEPSKTFLKAMPLRDLSDLDIVKNEVRSGNILILRITPLANKSVEDVKRAVNELCEFVESLGGDIARLGEERVVVCPPNIKIWREKPQVASEPVPTAA
ncbi:MAG: cell division protein SepF [Candidatus Bathyarchaeia archaeon]